MECCIRCFAHDWLRDFIAKKAAPLHTCDVCGSASVPVVAVTELTPYFQNLMELYEPSGGSAYQTLPGSYTDFAFPDPLTELIQEDWGIFNQKQLDQNRCRELLETILGLEAGTLLPADPGGSEGLYFRSRAILSINTDLPDPSDPRWYYTPVSELGSFLRHARWELKEETSLYRARSGYKLNPTGTQRMAYEGVEIGAPPQNGQCARANRAGDRVLYCATEEATAIAEKRPARGAWLSVCSLNVVRPAKLVDLTERGRRPNPFTSSRLMAKYIAWKQCEHFGQEMSTPLERDDDPSEYTDSQNFVQFVRRCDFDGIRYPSALAPTGSNVVLFDPAIASIGPSRLVRVTSVMTTYDLKTAIEARRAAARLR